MNEAADGVLSIDKPRPTRSTRLQGQSATQIVELDQAVRHLQDLARGRLAEAPTNHRRGRGKSRA
jgi:hypothetical protein